jgi:rhodanese-related sulfurtransferase
VTEARRILTQAVAIGALAVAVGAAVNVPLLKRFARGEFRESFFVQADYPGVRMISLAEAEDVWRTGEALFLDARAAGLYRQGHVPRARSLPEAADGRALPGDLAARPKDRPFVVYCEGGDCHSSLALAKRLHDEGFRDVRVFSGGWEEWRAAGLPEETGDDQE